MNPLMLALAEPGAIFDGLRERLGARAVEACWRRFPDGESYLRIDDEVMDREVIVVARLSPPDPVVFQLVLAADTLRDLGARRVGLVAPYLAYMRQDTRFRKGEAVSSRPFASLVSENYDWLVTVDPHLHRYVTLNEIYTLPNTVCRAAPSLAAWIGDHVERPLLIGPDDESRQWVDAVAAESGLPSQVLEKHRRGDRDVEVSVPDVDRWLDHTPVLVDDIVSTGRTLIEAVGHLRRSPLPPPVCVAIHGVFGDAADRALLDAGARRVVTCNTLPHPTNAIDLSAPLADSVRALAEPGPDPA